MQNAGSLGKRRPRNLSTIPRRIILFTPTAFSRPSTASSLSSSASRETRDLNSNSPPPKLKFSEIYLLSYATVFKLRLLIYVGRCVFLFPWTFKWDKQKLEILKLPFKFRLVFYVFSILTFVPSFVLTIFHVNEFISNLSSAGVPGGSYRLAFKSLELIMWHLHSAMMNLLLTIYRENMRIYINTLFDLNRELLERYRRTDGMGVADGGDGGAAGYHKSGGKLFLNVTVPVLLAQVLVSFFRYLAFYNAPVYMTSQLSEDGSKERIPFVVVLLSAIQDVMTSGQLVSGVLFIGWVTVAHSISLEFWMQEAHQDVCSPLTRDLIREPSELPSLYRTLSVLSTLFNRTVGIVGIPMSAFINWSAAIPCGYVAVRSLNRIFIDEFPASLLYPMGITLTLCSAFGQFQKAATMHDMSGSLLDSWSLTEDKGLRRFLLSCRMIKVEALGVSSVTRGSLVTYMQTLSDHIIDCIMTFP